MTEQSDGRRHDIVVGREVTSAATVSEDRPDLSLLVLRVLPTGARRESAIRLLLRTGRSGEFVAAACEEGQVLGFAAIDGDSHDGLVGALLSVPTGVGRTAELRIFALAARAAVVGGEMLSQFADSRRARGFHRIVAHASNAEVELMGLFVDAGYRFLHVERDACTPDRGFPRDRSRLSPHRDLVWFELEL